MKKIFKNIEVTMDAGIGIKIEPNGDIVINNKHNNQFNLTEHLRKISREESAKFLNEIGIITEVKRNKNGKLSKRHYFKDDGKFF